MDFIQEGPIQEGFFPIQTVPGPNEQSLKGEGCSCNTPGVTMAMAHLCTNDCDHMWKKLEEKSIKTLETMFYPRM